MPQEGKRGRGQSMARGDGHGRGHSRGRGGGHERGHSRGRGDGHGRGHSRGRGGGHERGHWRARGGGRGRGHWRPLNVIINMATPQTQKHHELMNRPAQQHPYTGRTSATTTMYDPPPPYSPPVDSSVVFDGGVEHPYWLMQPDTCDGLGQDRGQPKDWQGRGDRGKGWVGGRGRGNQLQNRDTTSSQDSDERGAKDTTTISKQLNQFASRIRNDLSSPPIEPKRPQAIGKIDKKTKGAVESEESVTKDVQKLQVSLLFSKCFENENEPKRLIESTLQKPQNNYFRIHFEQVTLLHKASQTNCLLIISSLSNNEAEKHVKAAVFQLKKRIKTGITFSMQNYQKTHDGGEISEGAGIERKEEKKPASRGPAPISQTLQLILEKRFEPPSLLVDFIKQCLGGATFNYHVDKESIKLSESSTICLICTDSKADAKRLKKTLLNAQATEQVKLTCHECSVDESTREDTADGIQSQISEAISCAEVAKEETLRQHVEKVEDYQDELDSLSDIEDNAWEEYTSALCSQITRLEHQKSEFLHMYSTLCRKLQSKDPSEVESEDIANFLESFGRECNRLLVSHPVYSWRKAILGQLKETQVCIISGDPGSGKSTQVVQYLLDAGYANRGVIVCCQSKTSAVEAISDKVARELIGRVGDLVGYKTETVSKVDESKTKILFVTETHLLNECLKEPGLRKYSCIVLDEAQEGRANTNFLMGIIKGCLQRRKELRLVILKSPAGDHQALTKFFNVEREIRVSEGKFPVQVIHEEESENFANYETKAVDKAAEIHYYETAGHILIFLSTPLEIMRCSNDFEKRFDGFTDFKCITLHDCLPAEEINKISEKAPEGVRKIIFASACAESFIPPEKITYVIDSGVATQKDFDPKRNLRISGVCAISKSSAIQRKNLLGSWPNGKCYRLYSEDDFESLPTRDTPEIQRANLGQIVLKLTHLEVDAQSFEVPQAPRKVAVDSALQMLVKLGAIVGNKITDLGKWISALPYDVANSYLVHQGTKLSLTYDAVVLATLMYHSHDIELFYNSLSDDESENVAARRCQLSSPLGDVFTSLSVFKTWNLLPKIEKAEWCRQNGVNYKAMGFIRNFIDDTLAILKANMNIDVAKTFSDRESDLEILRKLAFDTNIASVCHSSDEHKDSFSSLVTQHMVSLHPKSSLFLTETHPEWIVFTDLLKTSREYIKGVIVAKEEWVQEAVESQAIKVDLTELKRELVFRGDFGPAAFVSVVGPLFRGLWELGDKLSDNNESACVLEADQDFGILKIFSNCALDTNVVERLNRIKTSVLEQVGRETYYFSFAEFSTSMLNDGEMSYGYGGLPQEFTDSTENDRIEVFESPENVSMDDLLTKFETFGQVKEVDMGGEDAVPQVTFRSILEAFTAVECVAGDPLYSIELYRPDEWENTEGPLNVLLVKLSWLQPPIKDKSRALVECSPLDRPILIGRSLEISGKACEINVSPDDTKALIIMGIGSATEEDIKEKLNQKLRKHGRSYVNLKVSVSKNSAPQEEPDHFKKMKDFIHSLLLKHVQETDFLVNLPMISENHSRYVCYVGFYDPIQGERVCREMNRCYEIDGQEIEFSLAYSTVLRVPRTVKEMCQEQFSDVIDNLIKTYDQLNIEWKGLGEDFVIEIECSKHEPVQKAITFVNEELQGEIVDCSTNAKWECLLNKWGQNRLKTIQQITDCLVISDTRVGKIHLYGSKSNVRQAIDEINSYLSDDIQMSHLNLQIPGLLVSTLSEYGPTLDGLVEDCCLNLAKLNIPNKSLQVVGSPAAIEDAAHRLRILEDKLKKQEKVDVPVCAICKCLTVKESFHCLEMCNHLYCFDCLSLLANAVVKNDCLPMVCIKEGCETVFAARDVHFVLSNDLLTKKDYAASALRHARCSDVRLPIRCCPTFNCPMAYTVCQLAMGVEHVCPLCMASVCKSCHKPFHRGMPCHVVKEKAKSKAPETPSTASDQSRKKILAWMSKN